MSPVPTIPTASLNLQTYSLKPTAYSLAPQVPGSAEFRHFGFSTFAPQKPPKMRLAPTHDRHNTCKRKKSRVSPYVTFDFARLARVPQPPIRAARVSKRYQKRGISDRAQHQPPISIASHGGRLPHFVPQHAWKKPRLTKAQKTSQIAPRPNP